MRTWGALVLVRAPSESVSVGQWLAEQLRRRDLVGETDGGEWTLFLPEETVVGPGAAADRFCSIGSS